MHLRAAGASGSCRWVPGPRLKARRPGQGSSPALTMYTSPWVWCGALPGPDAHRAEASRPLPSPCGDRGPAGTDLERHPSGLFAGLPVFMQGSCRIRRNILCVCVGKKKTNKVHMESGDSWVCSRGKTMEGETRSSLQPHHAASRGSSAPRRNRGNAPVAWPAAPQTLLPRLSRGAAGGQGWSGTCDAPAASASHGPPRTSWTVSRAPRPRSCGRRPAGWLSPTGRSLRRKKGRAPRRLRETLDEPEPVKTSTKGEGGRKAAHRSPGRSCRQ